MDQRLMTFYDNHRRRFGTEDPRALGWRDEDSQVSRFKVLADVGDLTGASVLDEGCGFGDLYPFLRERCPGIRYTGIDINAESIAAARTRYPDAGFEVADFSEYSGGPFDHVLSSGALTFRIKDYDRIYKEHIRKMFEMCTKAVAFNVLDRKGITETIDYVGWDRSELVAYCLTLTPNVRMRNDYSPEDLTLFLYR